MKLRFFADQCVPNFIIQSLREADYEVLRLKELMPNDSPDPEVIAKAQEMDAILISLDGDFADIVRYPPSKYKGILAFQVRNHPEIIPPLMERLKAHLLSHPDMSYYQGRLFLVEVHRIRIRRELTIVS
jgi:predicted nuclease of predicted toxin-antitoxin system